MAARGGWVVLVALAFVFAGCLETAGSGAKAKNVDLKIATGARVGSSLPDLTYLVHDAVGGKVTPPPELEQPIQIIERLVGKRGAEPTGGVTKKGTVFVVAGLSTMRSRDHGVTWEEVYHHGRQGVPGLNGSSDVMLWVDPVTDRIYTDHMFGLFCSNMAFSDDEGQTWTQRPLACGIPVNDHQKWASGPWSNKVPKPPGTYGSVVYYCYNKLVGGTWCAVSYNGGLAFTHDQPVLTSQNSPCGGGINGHPAPAPDGTMYVPRTLGCNRPVVAVTEDNGVTWTVRIGPDKFGGLEIDPDVTVTPDGTAYMSYRGRDQFQYLVRSKDKFATWEGPFRISPPHLTATVFTGITSGDNGRIAIAYLGTKDPIETEENKQKDPSRAANGTRWHLFVTYSVNAADKEPIFATTQATPDEDPVQIGCVWLRGGGNPCRNLLDFIDLTSDREGRIFVAFSDGCTTSHASGPCAYNVTAKDTNSRSRDMAVAIVGSGPSLVAAQGRIETAIPAE